MVLRESQIAALVEWEYTIIDEGVSWSIKTCHALKCEERGMEEERVSGGWDTKQNKGSFCEKNTFILNQSLVTISQREPVQLLPVSMSERDGHLLNVLTIICP